MLLGSPKKGALGLQDQGALKKLVVSLYGLTVFTM